jgi:hypothetical protein
VNRLLTTALGWRLPSWLLAYGPVAFIVVEGSLAIAFHAEQARVRPLVSGLIVTAVALVFRHRALLAVLAVVLAVSLIVGYGPIVVLPVLLDEHRIVDGVAGGDAHRRDRLADRGDPAADQCQLSRIGPRRPADPLARLGLPVRKHRWDRNGDRRRDRRARRLVGDTGADRGLAHPDAGCVVDRSIPGQESLLARERLAGGALDLDVDQLTAGAQAAEVHDLVVARAAPQAGRICPRGPLDEHL